MGDNWGTITIENSHFRLHNSNHQNNKNVVIPTFSVRASNMELDKNVHLVKRVSSVRIRSRALVFGNMTVSQPLFIGDEP